MAEMAALPSRVVAERPATGEEAMRPGDAAVWAEPGKKAGTYGTIFGSHETMTLKSLTKVG